MNPVCEFGHAIPLFVVPINPGRFPVIDPGQFLPPGRRTAMLHAVADGCRAVHRNGVDSVGSIDMGMRTSRGH